MVRLFREISERFPFVSARKIIYAFRVKSLPSLIVCAAPSLRRYVFSGLLRQCELISPRFPSRGLSTDFHSDRVSTESISVSHFNLSSRHSRYTTLKFLSSKLDYAIHTSRHANRYFANSQPSYTGTIQVASRSNFRLCQFQVARVALILIRYSDDVSYEKQDKNFIFETNKYIIK